MKYIDEYRDAEAAGELAAAIAESVRQKWTIMEICGGQTHAIMKFGVQQLLPDAVNLVHGPGCPVCVTPLELVDKALQIAALDGITLCSFGDMLRVPGSSDDLLSVKARGADVRIVYSPLDAVAIARDNPDHEIVFFAVGFETTAPANALAVRRACDLGLRNFSMLVSQARVPPAIAAILADADNRIQGFLAAGHVCAVMGYREYIPLARRYRVPMVVTGFEPVDLLRGLWCCVRQLEAGRHEVENAYGRVVRPAGNPIARALIEEVFEVVPRSWRGIGEIPDSGYGLRPAFREFDAERRFAIGEITAKEPADCLSGAVLRGVRKPDSCPMFGVGCTPEHPLGATMVSAEGACAAYYRYRPN